MSEERVVQGVVVAHGEMADGLVDAVRRISGAGDDALLPLTNTGKSPESLQSEIYQLLGRGPVIIFTDLPSGSCALAAQLCCQEGGEEVVIFGVNLPMLLDFVFHRHLPLTELVPRLLEKGRGSVQCTPADITHAHRPVSG